MNIFKKVLQGTVILVIIIASMSVFAGAYDGYTDDFEYLKKSIATIDSICEKDIQQFVVENRGWIKELSNRLDKYLLTIPEEQRHDVITRLMGGDPSTRSNNLDEYFNSTEYHLRGGYWTYSLDPKWSVRLLFPTLKAAWEELETVYDGIRDDNGSLWNQYMCHYDLNAFGIAANIWDLEEGRPLIDYSGMVDVLCNPE